MPYIKQERRQQLCDGILKEAATAGDLNYMFTELCKDYMSTGESYQKYNDCIGALEGAKLELYRRRVAPYEDTKIEENGDIY